MTCVRRHDEQQRRRGFWSRLFLMKEGRVLASGPPEEVLTPEKIGEAYGVKALVFRNPAGEWDYTVQV